MTDAYIRLPRRPVAAPLRPLARRWHLVVAMLKDAGLVSARTWAGDIDMPSFVAELRREQLIRQLMMKGQDHETPDSRK